MDIFAHALWTLSIYWNYPNRWLAMFIGIVPDIIAITPHLMMEHFTRPGQALYDVMYQISHSLIILLVITIIVFIISKKAIIVLGAWALHIIFDIFTHVSSYYPTPYLWPLPSPSLFAVDYRNPQFMIINYAIIALVLLILVLKGKNIKRTKRKKK